ncbi:hypothetical protein [Flavobacterium sp.]|uniref:hypothetical protein n=2 Tax=Flavobacterium sp. TaxID=239 RepID=UPI00404753EE
MKLTQNQKKAGIVVGALAVITLGYFAFRKKADGSTGYNDPTGNNNADTGNNTVSTFNAKTKADNLYALMDMFGTKEDEIISELTNVTQSQFAQIISAFGLRNYNTWTGGDDWGGSPLGLVGWLKEELGITSEEYRTLKLKYPNYL